LRFYPAYIIREFRIFAYNMKHILTLIICISLSASGYAQKAPGNKTPSPVYFEGTIEYSMKLTGDMASMMAAFLPESMHFKFKDNHIAMIAQGGMMSSMGHIVYNGDQNEAFMIDKSNRKVYKMSRKSDDLKPKPPVVVKESEVVEIAGYKCTKYKIGTRDKDGNAQFSYLWATDQLQIRRNESGAADARQLQSFMIKGVEGVPLKMMNTQAGVGTIVLTATKVNKETISEAQFKIPEGYAIEEFDPMKAGR
jgi:hypothetical protein